MNKIVTLIALLISISFSAFSQKKSFKFGKIDQNNLEMEVYEKDSTAEAVVLFDYGKSYFVYNNSKNEFQIVHERHRRVKIINENGFDYADIQIPYYRDNNFQEYVSLKKAATYNLEGGKLVTSKFDGKKNLFEEKSSRFWYYKKFTMPNVKKGSIIEYSYSITSNHIFNLREWTFQEAIPVVWSEYIAQIPEYYSYQKLRQGWEPFQVDEEKTIAEEFNIKYRDKIQPGTTSSRFGDRRQAQGSYNISSQTKKYRWVLENAPALREENFITTIDDYVNKIDFELELVQMPNSAPSYQKLGWPDVAIQMMQRFDFGIKMTPDKYIISLANEITKGKSNNDEKLAAIYNYVISNLKWNRTNTKYAERGFKKIIESQSGNSADINLLLVALYKAAGFQAEPVILSTRNNGKADPNSPVITNYNYVICRLTIGVGKYLLIDGTNPLLPLGTLPMKCINGYGKQISSTGVISVPLSGNANFTYTISANMELNADGTITGNVASSDVGYSAYFQRKRYFKGDKKEFIEKKKEVLGEDVEISNFEIKNSNKTFQPFKMSYDAVLENSSNVAADMIYLEPLLGFGIEENEFKSETRKLPIDFGYKTSETFILNLKLPEGFVVESKPKNINMSLPEKGGRFMYTVNVLGNTIQLMSRVSLTKSIFSPQQYPNLREFYNQVVAKHAEQIVLKKAN